MLKDLEANYLYQFVPPSILEEYRKLFKEKMDVTKNISQEVAVTEFDEDTFQYVNVTIQEPIEFENITEEHLQISANMFVYLYFMPSDEFFEWKKFLLDVLDKDFSDLLLTLNRIYHTTKTKNRIIEKVLTKILKTIEFNLAGVKGKT